jgi:putative flippase GtrA
VSRTARDLFAFGAVGVVTVCLDVSILVLARSGLGWHLPLATATAFIGSTAVNFLGHRSWSGREARAGVPQHVGRYLVLLLLNLILTTGTVTALAEAGVHYLGAKLVAIVLTSVVSFVSYPRWVFV